MDPTQLKNQFDQTQYLSDAIKGVDLDVLKSQYQQSADLHANAERINFNNEVRTNRNQQQIIDQINDKAATGISAVERNGTDNLLATERSSSTINDNMFRIAQNLDTSMYRNTADVRNDIASTILAQTTLMQQQQANSQDNLNRSTNELLNNIQNGHEAAALNTQTIFRDLGAVKADLLLQGTNQFGALARQASDNTAAIQLEGMKNTAILSKQLSNSEANIKDVLRTQEADRLRDALRATEHKSLYFELKNQHHHRKHHH